MGRKRFHIAFLEANVMDKFSNEVVRGAMAAAEKCDIDMTIFPVKYVNHDVGQDVDALFEYQYNALLSLAATGGFDYIVASIGSIGYACTMEKKIELLSLFGDTPVLCICDEIPGYDFVRYENFSGVNAAVDYLVQSGRKHICMMAGDSNNVDCEERFQSYRSALERNHMPFEECFSRRCDLAGRHDGQIDALLDENPEVDAIICATDMIAVTVCAAIKQRRKKIGEDIAVVGFDDLPFAAKYDPPLASVRADARELGFRAVQRVSNILKGCGVGDNYLQSTFVPRASCMYEHNLLVDKMDMFEGGYEKIATNVLTYIFENQELLDNYVAVKSFCVYAVSMIMERIVEGRCQEEDVSYICHMLESYFDGNQYRDDTLLRIVDVFEYAIEWIKNEYKNKHKAQAMERMRKTVYKKFMTCLISVTGLESNHMLDYAHNTNLVIRESLMFGEDLKQGYANVLSKLYALDLKTSYLYLLAQPLMYRNGEVFPLDVQWQFKAYQEGVHAFAVPAEEQKVKADYIFENPFITDDERHTFIVVDLYSREYQYGVLLCEIQSEDFLKSWEFVVYQMSAAVKMVGLLDMQNRMLEELHTKNLSLEEESKLDELTGLYNRRGFYEAANKLVVSEKNVGKELIVCYADMDKLKVVNDTYGHIEGDYALNSLANCLKTVLGKSAVIGRVGGDEFVAVVCKDDIESVDAMLHHKEQWIAQLNATSAKSYYIDMSMGLYECRCQDSYDLKDAIDKADDILYTIKVKRKTNR